MKETRSLIGKMLTAILILFVFSVPFMSSASASYKPLQAGSLPTTQLFLTPSRINGTSVGQTVTVYANVTGVTKLHTFQIGLIWSNTSVAQCTNVILGNIFTGHSTIAIPGTIDNTNGIITPYSWAGTGSTAVTGSGTLAVFTFTISHTGYADMHLSCTFLANSAEATIPCNTVDYFTVASGGHQYIVEVQGNPSESNAVPPDSAGFYWESVTKMSPAKTEGGVSNLAGNLTFAMNGTSMDNGAFGYFNVTIPNNLMNCNGNNADWVVELNNGTGIQLETTRTVTSGATTTTISLALQNFYPSGTYGTTIVNIYAINTAVPEFASTLSSILLATVLAIAALAAALFVRTTQSRKQKS